MAKDIIRRARFARFTPYTKGAGPVFNLTMWDSGRYDSRGQTIIRYRLTMRDNGRATVLFDAEDFSCSPMYADDSDECVRSLMSFLTLRPGDTDDDYFAAYTPEQLAYCEAHAEYLNLEVMRRYGEEC